MPVPVQCLPLDSGPALPKPGRAHVMGSDSHMLDTACVEGNGHSPSNDSPRVRSDVLDAADVQSSDDMDALSVRASAISDGCGSGLSSRHHHVDHFESRPIPTRKSSTSIADKRVGSQQTPTLPNSQSRARNDFDQGRHNEKTSGRYESPSLGPTQPQPWDDESTHTMIPQLETRPISQDQLVPKVKGIYAGLVMAETKCMEVDNIQSPNTETNTTSKLNNEQWQALIALHRTLLHEHHDFFFASQHPSGGPALRRLASKYAMPARMWRHGIHSFLELLRHQLPGHILMFLYLAYSMMALLFEMVPAFEDTWIECLGDLGRYCMAIEDDDVRDREAWTEVSHHWYIKASDGPTTGRLYHHLAILARPNALQQLSYYTKSLCARESIMTLSGPVRRKFVKLRWLLFSAKRGPVDLSYLHLVLVTLLHLTRTHTDIPCAVMFEFLHLMHECLTLYRFEPYTIESFSRYPSLPRPLPEDWIPDLREPTLGERQLKLWLKHHKVEPRISERQIHDVCPIHHTHNSKGFSPGSVEMTIEELLLPAYLVHFHELDCVAAKISAFFRIVWWTSVCSFYLPFRTFERVSSSYCSDGLPALSLL